MLKILTEINGVSGNEKSVSDFILSQVRIYCDETIVDSMGNLIFHKKGKKDSDKKIAVFAHMDEVGLIVTDITEDGYIKFAPVGGIDDRILLAKRVFLCRSGIEGVIGIKAVHLQSKEERQKVISYEDMYIDIGAKDKDDALNYVKKGDYIAFKSKYERLYDRRFKGKAVDDRAGCAIMMELMKDKYDADLYFCFTVQEETGLRGAKVLSKRIDPDVAIILEATTASDVAFSKRNLYGTHLGKGPVITLMDRGSYSDIEFRKFITGIADAREIKYQYKLTSNGGNDAREIQTGASGCKVCSISLPCRYIHSPNCVFDGGDYDEMKRLARAVINQIEDFSCDV